MADTSTLEAFVVMKNNHWNYHTIQEAIDAAQDGETIRVYPGTYEENLIIKDKGIHLTSEDPTDDSIRDSTVIDAGANGQAGIQIIATAQSSDRRSETTAIIEGFTITHAGSSTTSEHRSPAVTSGIHIIGASPIIRNNLICQNSTDYYGGGILVENSAVDISQRISVIKNQPQIYSNTIKNNRAEKGGGIFIDADSVISNADGDPWKYFNVPEASVTFIEGNSQTQFNNTYQNNILSVSSGNRQSVSDGMDICFDQIITPAGELSVQPESAIEQSNVQLQISYCIGTQFHDGELQIEVPEGFEISDNASVTIGEDKKTAGVFSPSATSITITGINLLEGIITLKLENQAVPTGMSAERNNRDVSYAFKAISDADGESSAWGPTGESTILFTSTPLSVNTDFTLNHVNPELIQCKTTGTATEIKVASGTTVETLLQNVESADGSNQTYVIYNRDINPLTEDAILTEGATLVVVSERRSNQREYPIAISLTPFIRLTSFSEETGIVKRNNRPGSDYLTTWHDTIASAVASANTTVISTITIWPDIYKETQMEIIGKSLTIQSIDDNAFTIDMAGQFCRAFNITTNASVTISDAIIRNANPIDSFGGGAIYLANSALHLENTNLFNNSSEFYGGGIYVEDNSVLSMQNCLIDSNKAKTDSLSNQMGGGVCLKNSSFYAIDTMIVNNEAGRYGGGLYTTQNGECILENCTISNNLANRDGGGLYIFALSHQNFLFSAEKLTVGFNEADKGGGMLIGGNVTYNIDKSEINANNANTLGGGIYSGATGTVNECTITSNQVSGGDGGGIYVLGDQITITNSTVVNNQATGNGGGLYLDFTEANISQTLIRGNNSVEGSGVYIIKSTDSAKDILTDTISWTNDIGSQTDNLGISPKDQNVKDDYETGIVYNINVLNDYAVAILDNSSGVGYFQLYISD